MFMHYSVNSEFQQEIIVNFEIVSFDRIADNKTKYRMEYFMSSKVCQVICNLCTTFTAQDNTISESVIITVNLLLMTV